MVGNVAGPVAVGLTLGVVLVLVRQLPSRWAGLVILATMAPTVVLLVNNVRKLLLAVLVVDIVLGLDISLAERSGHIGAPSGFIVSLMTIALAVGYALWITNKPGDGKPKVYTHKDITLPALIYLFALLVSAFQAVDVRLSITQLFMEVQFVLIYFYVINHIRRWNHVRLIFSMVAVCLFLESALMLLQHFTDFGFSGLGIRTWTTGSRIASAAFRAAGTLGSANTAGTILAAFLTMTFAAYLANGRLANKTLASAALLLGVPALVLTQSRSAWAAFAVGVLLLTFQSLRRGKGTTVVLLLLVVGLLIGVGFREVIVERLTTDDSGSAEGRIWYTELAFNIIREHPFTGIGLNNLWEVQDDYLPLEIMRIEPEYRYIIHNKYWMVWTETGLFGFLAFLWLLLAACKRAVQSLIHARDPYASIAIMGLLATLVVYLIHMSSDPFCARTRMEFFWLVLALITATSHLIKKTERLEDPITQLNLPAKAKQPYS